MGKEITPVARFRSPFPDKFGIPRQAGVVPGLKGEIVFEKGFRDPEAIRGIMDFDYLWLVWGFSANEPSKAFQATVRPPRLGGNERVGVFASRSPFRPNGLGLSSVRLAGVRYDRRDSDGTPLGPVLEVLGADLMDGTPIYDIKPYVEYADSHPGARSGFVDKVGWKPLEVCVPAELESVDIDWTSLREVLAQDPRPRCQDDPERIYGMRFGAYDVRFRVSEGRLFVVGLEK